MYQHLGLGLVNPTRTCISVLHTHSCLCVTPCGAGFVMRSLCTGYLELRIPAGLELMQLSLLYAGTTSILYFIFVQQMGSNHILTFYRIPPEWMVLRFKFSGHSLFKFFPNNLLNHYINDCTNVCILSSTVLPNLLTLYSSNCRSLYYIQMSSIYNFSKINFQLLNNTQLTLNFLGGGGTNSILNLFPIPQSSVL